MQSETVNDESYEEYKYQIVVVEIKASHFNQNLVLLKQFS